MPAGAIARVKQATLVPEGAPARVLGPAHQVGLSGVRDHLHIWPAGSLPPIKKHAPPEACRALPRGLAPMRRGDKLPWL